MKSVTKINMKTPISYYGGKQQMVTTILPLIPPHHLYTEAFCGGAAIYWAKQPSTIEVINDKNSEVSNFYKVAKTNFEELQKMVTTTLHSREAYVKAMEIYKNPTVYTELERAWAFWVGCNMSYLSSIGGGFAYQRKGKNRCALKVANNRESFVVDYADRLRETTVEHDDALKVIQRYDCEEAFHYVDPPYFNANMGHYRGYTEDNFLNLLELLSVVKGKFLLSSYPSDLLSEFIDRNGWHKKEITMRSSATRNQKNKIEVLTANYDINQPLGKMISFGVSSVVEEKTKEVVLKAA